MFDDYIDLIIVKFIWLSQDKLLSFRLEWAIHCGIIPSEKSMIPMFSRYQCGLSIIKPCTVAQLRLLSKRNPQPCAAPPHHRRPFRGVGDGGDKDTLAENLVRIVKRVY